MLWWGLLFHDAKEEQNNKNIFLAFVPFVK